MERKNPRRLYRKLFYAYTFGVVIIGAALVTSFLSSMRGRIRDTNLDYIARMEQDAAAFIQQAEDVGDYIFQDLYRSSMEMEDLSRFLTESTEDYLRYQLDIYADSNIQEYRDIYSFLENAFEAYEQVGRIELVSYEKGEMTECYPEGIYYPGVKKGQRLKEILEDRIRDDNEISFRKEIRETASAKSIGCMVIVFRVQSLEKIQEKYPDGSLLVLDEEGNRVWGEMETYQKDEFLTAQKEERLEEYLRAYVETASAAGYQVISFLDRKQAAHMPVAAYVMSLGIAAVLLAVGITLINQYLLRLNQRLERILEGMDKVAKGELKVVLPVNPNGDELDLISENFNRMCQDMERYIQKSYLAEIEQKNAEMQALQSQINPHFLYNTLEAIRMKAISNGDREVGKMLYSMAVTFRAQVKEKDVITLMQELHYSEKYLELFEYRYKGRFKSSVECPFELANVPIIKFVLQPLIENYFVHGIRLTDEDNFIRIYVEKEADTVFIHLEDNGIGMEKEKIEEKNRELADNSSWAGTSIGISNVNRRVKAAYGERYGVRLSGREGGGTHIILTIRYEKEKSNEESYAD